jgi:hypothetical protein
VKLKRIVSVQDRAGGGKCYLWDSASSMERRTLRCQFLKKIFGLSFLPPAEVSDCFAFDFISNHPNDKRLEQFCVYLLENYIDADCSLSPTLWSECSASSSKTINACESSHAYFNTLFYSAHPYIFVLLSALRKIQN